MNTDHHALQEKLGHTFKSTKLLADALRHPSVNHKKGDTGVSPYERLEFLGDRVLGIVIAELLYKTYTKDPEGILAKRFTSLVRKEKLAQVADALDLAQYVETVDSIITESMIADACEALLGALYLDAGFETVKSIIEKLWSPHLQDTSYTDLQDAKSKLQEHLQGQGGALPVYRLLKKTGPDHDPMFSVEVSCKGGLKETADAPTKKQAEQIAAEKLLKRILS